jgi:hypothetical protein
MTARRSAKKSTRKGSSRRASPLSRLQGQLPPTLREYANQIRKQLDRLERELTRAQMTARRSAARLLREASQQLGRLEVAGEAGWRKLGASYQKDLLALLKRLEKAVAPPSARKAVRRKAKGAAEKAAAGAEATP